MGQDVVFPEKTIPLRASVKSKQFNFVSSTLQSEILLQGIGVSSVDVQFVQLGEELASFFHCCFLCDFKKEISCPLLLIYSFSVHKMLHGGGSFQKKVSR